jgi:hypothetical protein
MNLTNQKHLIMKTLKQIIKFLAVVAAPLVALILYGYYIQEIFSLNIIQLLLCHVALLLVIYNAIFYSYHMSNTRVFKRFNASIVPAFGLLIGHDDSGSIQILIGCVGIEFNYIGLCRKKPKGNHFKKENQL